MQLTDVLCYMVLTITVTASCVGAEEQKSEVEESQSGRKISKREATVLLDNYPLDRIFQKPKVIYRRISKQRYGPPKSKYGPPKVNRKPRKKGHKKSHKKPKKPISPHYGPPGSYPNKKRAPNQKSRYGPPKGRHVQKPGFGHDFKVPYYSFFVPDKPPGFGEPPMNNVGDYQHIKQSYEEPPVDFFGAPLKTSIKAVFSTPQSFQEPSQHYDIHDFNGDDYQYMNQHRYTKNLDMNYAHTRKQPTVAPNNPIFVTPTPIDYNADSLDPAVTEKQIMQDSKFFFRKKRPFYFADSKAVNRPWTPNKNDNYDNEIIVGGQYAEPPARYVAKFPPHSPMYEDNEDEDTFNPLHGYVDTDVALSANNSPYSNYKHSNMAFSPQNLNDAFSIIDKK